MIDFCLIVWRSFGGQRFLDCSVGCWREPSQHRLESLLWVGEFTRLL